MKYGFSEACLAHETGPRHPESPDRLRAIREGLKRSHSVEYVEPDRAGVEDLTLVHADEYVETIREFCADGGGEWDPDTVAVEETWDAILASVGIAQWVTEAAMDGEIGRETPFGLGRPPGHHAVTDDAMGFCFANNVAIAAQTALERGADGVAILDWDVHHGNGTEEIFYDRNDVFFASIHEEGIYPGSGDADRIGAGNGEGANLNVPLPAGAGDAAYRTAVEELVAPAFAWADPDLVLISAGFDAHEHDPISRMGISTEGYGVLTKLVWTIAEDVDAGLGVVLEGGYGLDVLADSITTVHEVFGGYEPMPIESDPAEAVREQIDSLAATHPAVQSR